VAAQAVLAVVWSEVPLLVAMGYLNRPLRGVVSIARELMTRHTVADILHLAGIALFLITMAVAAWSLRTTTLNRAVCLGWIFSVALMLFGTGLVYGAELTFWRAASMPLTLAVLIIATSQSVLRRPALLLGTSVGSLLAARLVWIAAGA
jgi:hypothetical protein